MAKYRIRAGKHHGPDLDKDGVRVVHSVGEIVELDPDFVKNHPNKFELVVETEAGPAVPVKPVAGAAAQPAAAAKK